MLILKEAWKSPKICSSDNLRLREAEWSALSHSWRAQSVNDASGTFRAFPSADDVYTLFSLHLIIIKIKNA